MTLRHMKIFVMVCKENSITLAAKKLYISQPAVSTAIKELEAYYGAPLFDRISKKLYLTQVGNTVYDYALHINSLFDDLEVSVMNTSSTGQLRIGSSVTIGAYFMPDYIKNFEQLYPNIQTYVTINSSDVIEQLVLSNDIDLALIEGVVHSENVISQEFIKDELVVICDMTHSLLQKPKVTVEDIAAQQFLMREKNSGTRELAESILSLYNVNLHPRWESTSTEAIIQGVKKGIGISILPYQLVKDSIKTNQVAKLEVQGVNFDRQYHIIYHKNKFLTPAAQEFIKICVK